MYIIFIFKQIIKCQNKIQNYKFTIRQTENTSITIDTLKIVSPSTGKENL
jgi:hypothetical protein